MSLSVVVLGSGTSLPARGRRPPAFLVCAGDDALMVDCGAGASVSAAAAGVGLAALRGVLLTHHHLDHTGDLAPLLFALHNPEHPPRRSPLSIWGPPGTGRLVDALDAAYGDWVTPRPPGRRVHELAPGRPLSTGPFIITPQPARHAGVCFCYRIEAAGRAVCLSGDTAPCDGLLRAARDADLLLCECGALEADDSPGHMSPTAAGEAAAAARARALVLTHLATRVLATDPLPRARDAFGGPVTLARDGLRIDL